jgi:hypothetical protein
MKTAVDDFFSFQKHVFETFFSFVWRQEEEKEAEH